MILLHSWWWASRFYDGFSDSQDLSPLGIPISTVTGWLTQQDTCFMCIWYFEFRTPSFLSRPVDANVCTCLGFSPHVCWLSHPPFFVCASFAGLFFSCFVLHVWFDYRFLQTVGLGLVPCYNCGLSEVSVNAFWCLKWNEIGVLYSFNYVALCHDSLCGLLSCCPGMS